MESSRFQASLGKMVLKIKVTDKNGQRLNLQHAFTRNLLKLLSLSTMMIGFMMAGWTQKKQALHDLAAGTYVSLK